MQVCFTVGSKKFHKVKWVQRTLKKSNWDNPDKYAQSQCGLISDLTHATFRVRNLYNVETRGLWYCKKCFPEEGNWK